MNTLHSFDEVFDTQVVFRKVLEAMSNPARTVSIAEQKSRLFGDCLLYTSPSPRDCS